MLPKGVNLVEKGEEEFGGVVEEEVKRLSEGIYGDHLMRVLLQCELLRIRTLREKT